MRKLITVIAIISTISLGLYFSTGRNIIADVNAMNFEVLPEIEQTIRSTATLEDNFADDVVHVVLSRHASQNFGRITPRDFPEVPLASVECIG
ncbi:MAG: hypothetical protein FWE31_05105 [Firmicutes bacterium]|nr:hypothetical protein [Bacillota bacterium]